MGCYVMCCLFVYMGMQSTPFIYYTINLCPRTPTHRLSAAVQDLPALIRTVRALLVDREFTIRTQAFRTARYLAADEEVVACMLQLNVDVLAARALEKDASQVQERMQVRTRVCMRGCVGVDVNTLLMRMCMCACRL